MLDDLLSVVAQVEVMHPLDGRNDSQVYKADRREEGKKGYYHSDVHEDLQLLVETEMFVFVVEEITKITITFLENEAKIVRVFRHDPKTLHDARMTG